MLWLAALAATPLISEHRLGQLCRAAVACKRPANSVADASCYRKPSRSRGGTTSRYAVPAASTTANTASSGSRGRDPAKARRCDPQHVPSTDRTEKRSLGACVFARGRGAILERCRDGRGRLRALAGAAVAGGEVEVSTRAGRRSRFKAKVDVSKSTITGGDLHGVCARGEAYVAIRDSRVVGAANQACYAYM